MVKKGSVASSGSFEVDEHVLVDFYNVINTLQYKDIIIKVNEFVAELNIDCSTIQGRSDAVKVADKVKTLKNKLEKAGKQAVSVKTTEIANFNEKRRDLRLSLEAIEAETRAPVEKWNLQEEIKAHHILAIEYDAEWIAKKEAELEQGRKKEEEIKAVELETARKLEQARIDGEAAAKKLAEADAIKREAEAKLQETKVKVNEVKAKQGTTDKAATNRAVLACFTGIIEKLPQASPVDIAKSLIVAIRKGQVLNVLIND